MAYRIVIGYLWQVPSTFAPFGKTLVNRGNLVLGYELAPMPNVPALRSPFSTTADTFGIPIGSFLWRI
jgi:hypothetical protein